MVQGLVGVPYDEGHDQQLYEQVSEGRTKIVSEEKFHGATVMVQPTY